MQSNKNTYRDTLQLIAAILSFDHPAEDLKEKLLSKSTNWDQFVIIASNHLVLMACYCRLQQKQALIYIPNELERYLNELTTINRNRNLTIIDEIKSIAAILEKNSIDYAFLKGAALMIGNYYEDIAERMVGDIDILIAHVHIDKAFDLLKKAGYDSLITFNYEDTNFRHYPRQLNSNKIAAIELHSTILNSNYKGLINEKKLLETVVTFDAIKIPNIYFLNISNILTAQINSNGYRFKSWNLKNIYDSLCLGLTQQTDLPIHKYTIDYISKFQIITSNNNPKSLELFNHKTAKRYTRSIKNYKFYNYNYKLKSMLYNLKNRLILFIYNKSYRHHVIRNKFL